MKREDDQELWDLLGQAAQPKVSPFFARNVLREIRSGDESSTWRRWLYPRRLVPATGLAAVLIALAIVRMSTPVHPRTDPSMDSVAKIEAQDYEVIADLDDLLASDDGNSLDDRFCSSGR